MKRTLSIQAAPQEVYRRIFRVGEWWDSQHSYSGDARNFTLEERPGGCFCEKLPEGGAVKHMEVVYLAPGKSLILRGAMGPFVSLAASGAMQIQLTAAEGGTKTEVTFAVAGYTPGGLNSLAAAVDSVLKDLFTRLKKYTEHGDPAAK